MKVYCKNCRFDWPLQKGYCGKARGEITNVYTGAKSGASYVPKNTRNSLGICEDYKRKRWKFWIRGKG